MAELFWDVGRGVTLCYEDFGDPADPTALLVMGLGVQMIGWREDFCRELAGRGFHVVRFDNRDAGRSTHFPGRPPSLRQLVSRRFGPEQYTLEDMAEDTAGLLRELDLGPAHVIGVSMGGMIAQTLAADPPDQVVTLTSIMSTTGSRLKGQPSLGIYRFLLKRAPRERDAYIEHTTRIFKAIGSPGFDQDENEIRELAARSYDRDDDRNATGRQLAAIPASRDRTPKPRRSTPHRHRSPAGRPPGPRRSPPQAPADHRAHARGPRRQGPAGLAVRREGHRQGHSRGRAHDGRGHGARPPPAGLAPADGRDRRASR